MDLLKMAVVVIVSWLLGVAAYLLSLYLLYGEVVGSGAQARDDFIMDIITIVCYSLVMIVIVYWRMMMSVQKRLLSGSAKPAFVFPLVASSLFVVPTLFFLMLSGDRRIEDLLSSLSSWFSPDMIPLYSMFIVIGILFGLGYVWVERTTPKRNFAPSNKSLLAQEAVLSGFAEPRRPPLYAPPIPSVRTENKEQMSKEQSYANYRRLMEMVGHLHKMGYERLRLDPGIAASGFFWRCHVLPVTLSGQRIRIDVDLDEEGDSSYSSSEGDKFFGWTDAGNDTPQQLAAKFIERFPKRAGLGFGADEEYAGWYARMLEQTAPMGIIYGYADYPLPAHGGMGVINLPEDTFIQMPPNGRA